MTLRTNAMRLLDGAKIAYEVCTYPVDESDLSAERAAEKLGRLPETVFKTLIAEGDITGFLFALLPAGTKLEPRSLAQVSGNKRVELLALKDVQTVTGYLRGGVSVLGAKKKFPVFLDNSATRWNPIAISAGKRGVQILIAPDDLIRVTGAVLADLTP